MTLYDSCRKAEDGAAPQPPPACCCCVLHGFCLLHAHRCAPSPPAKTLCPLHSRATCRLAPDSPLPFLPGPAGFMLDRPLVLLYHCLLAHPFQVVSWGDWARVLQGLDGRDQ